MIKARIIITWHKLKDKQPSIGQTVIVWNDSVPCGTMDVALYDGLKDDGHRFWMGNTQYDPTQITHWTDSLQTPIEIKARKLKTRRK